ncbi:IMPACT family protein [Arthrospiribacter ruber]|uniref:YigZ family protein n=1 Tax=Arthrospiribacter ruber TaxID=2487934 RepID=A0A951IUP0_9BACT|nr:YigZ family protein [Arthrospiribacter ruber]MBW3466294.1 YigZ family protein [Arthrospiribacter ruber]
MKDTYLTISTPSEGFYKEKGSKFLAFAFPVSTEDQIKDSLEELRKKYYDARHHCYAYMLGKDMEVFRSNDDGEPNHSAGDPILGQIRSANLTDVLIVVVRYFGGTKLGVGGLITAYKAAASDAISNASILEKIVYRSLALTVDYSEMNEVMRIIKEFDLNVSQQVMELKCTFHLEVRENDYNQVREKFDLLQALGQIEIIN